jgi:citrate lyase subunit beta-like protein
MYVPGNDDRKIAKIPSLNADCVVLDCEDGVAANKKVRMRRIHTVNITYVYNCNDAV